MSEAERRREIGTICLLNPARRLYNFRLIYCMLSMRFWFCCWVLFLDRNNDERIWRFRDHNNNESLVSIPFIPMRFAAQATGKHRWAAGVELKSKYVYTSPELNESELWYRVNVFIYFIVHLCECERIGDEDGEQEKFAFCGFELSNVPSRHILTSHKLWAGFIFHSDTGLRYCAFRDSRIFSFCFCILSLAKSKQKRIIVNWRVRGVRVATTRSGKIVFVCDQKWEIGSSFVSYFFDSTSSTHTRCYRRN